MFPRDLLLTGGGFISPSDTLRFSHHSAVDAEAKTLFSGEAINRAVTKRYGDAASKAENAISAKQNKTACKAQKKKVF